METFAAALLVVSAVYCTFRTRFVQFRRFGRAVSVFFSRDHARDDGVTPFQACSTSLAATIGTGNIAGVAGAILLGGPGAVFWMWVSALLGMAAKYLEIYLGVHAARLPCQNAFAIGPMRCVETMLGARYRPLAKLFALFCLIAALSMGNIVQSRTLAEGVSAFVSTLPRLSASVRTIEGASCFAAALLLLAPVFGGAKRVGRIAAALVPFMSALYILVALVVLGINAAAVPRAFGLILNGAFAPRAVLSGAAGISVSAAFRVGVSRGVFTHEAGVGTASLAHASVASPNAHKQALYGIFEVFLDTIVMCTLTALVILVGGAPLAYGDASVNGALVIESFAGLLGMRLSAGFLSLSLALFAFSSMLSYSLYGAECALYLFGKRAHTPYRIAFVAICALAFMPPTAFLWRMAEWANALTAIANTIIMALVISNRKGGEWAAIRSLQPY